MRQKSEYKKKLRIKSHANSCFSGQCLKLFVWRHSNCEDCFIFPTKIRLGSHGDFGWVNQIFSTQNILQNKCNIDIFIDILFREMLKWKKLNARVCCLNHLRVHVIFNLNQIYSFDRSTFAFHTHGFSNNFNY